MVKGLKCKMYEEQLKLIHLFSQEKWRQRGDMPHGSLQLPHEGEQRGSC